MGLRKCARPTDRRFSFGLFSGLQQRWFDFLVGRKGVGLRTLISILRTLWTWTCVELCAPPPRCRRRLFATAKESKLRRRAAAERPQVRKWHRVVFKRVVFLSGRLVLNTNTKSHADAKSSEMYCCSLINAYYSIVNWIQIYRVSRLYYHLFTCLKLNIVAIFFLYLIAIIPNRVHWEVVLFVNIWDWDGSKSVLMPVLVCYCFYLWYCFLSTMFTVWLCRTETKSAISSDYFC